MTDAAPTPEIPRLYAYRGGRAVAPPTARAFALLVAGGCLAVLLTAVRLPPNPAGYGSHRGIGLPSCAWMERGVPCPACGMTTSFSWFVRGNLPASIYVQPMGAALAAAAAACVWGGLYVGLTGRPVYRLVHLLPARAWLVGLLGFGLAAWGWKVFAHLHGIDGWST
ncbi:MAG: hypothetical protein JWO31_1826 [Phycisphaerales bacterium]|nr:hypothetical protein [Phycisphaerales bacterium]